ncbi:hypothetical protein [Cecembia rubra]|uniref:hypothetical protein n=1 Tax=Cecembia rubra TaxID=1485585 RepID=UPI002714BD1C|nr:hypothetical protein [Cecembia rubra]
MANQENQLDRYFREKLVEHEEKPSHLVWERLDQNLGNNKPGFSPLWKSAAIFLLILGFGYIFWQVSNTGDTKNAQVAENKDAIPADQKYKANEDLEGMETIENATTDRQAQVIEQDAEEYKPSHHQNKKPSQKSIEPNTPLFANNEPIIEKIRLDENIPQVTEISLPELKLSETIAFNSETQEKEEAQEETISYRITIKSNGLKEETKKQNIIEGLENNVNKIGAFLEKVEQGFADLQDAKENLFASNTPRKERSK